MPSLGLLRKKLLRKKILGLIKINTGVCASIIEENEEKIIETIKSLPVSYVEYIELRLDSIKNITSSEARDIITSVKEITSIPIILTNRSREEGGLSNINEEDRIKILKDNAALVEITDVELMTDKTLIKQIVQNANKTIISYHNFNNTPKLEELQKIVNKAFEIGDIPKIAVKPNSFEDTYTLVELLMHNKGIIGISMGDIGTYTRIIAPLMGSPVTYASINQQSAPGQLDIKSTSEMIKKLMIKNEL